MKRPLLSILSFILIVFLFFITYSFFQSEATVRTFKHLSSPQYQISRQLLNRYHSEDITIKAAAEKEIINISFKGLDLVKWQEYIDYIQVQVFEGQIIPNSNNQALIALNLSKDLAIIGIYDLVGDHFVYHSKIEGLTPIDDIQLYKISSADHKAIIVYQSLDERLGGYFYEEFIDIFYYLTGEFKSVWHKTLYFEELYRQIWVDPKGDKNLWNRVIEEVTLDFIENDPFSISAVTSLKKYVTKSMNPPAIEEFSLVESSTHRDSYYWSDQYNSFILGEITQDVFLYNAALLSDLSRNKEALYGIQNYNYKIITTNGELIYLPKNKFKGMFQFILQE